MKKGIILSIIILTIFSIEIFSAENLATIIKKKGGVNLKLEGEMDYLTPGEIGMSIKFGDALKTDIDGFAAVIFSSDKSMLKIRSDSEIEFKEELSTRTVNIKKGRVHSKITPGENKSFRIATPTSVASVKGTDFMTIVSEIYGDRFYGVEGTVEIVNLITGMEAILEAGQMILSTPSGELLNIPIAPEDFPSDMEDEEEEPVEPEIEDTEDAPEVPVEDFGSIEPVPDDIVEGEGEENEGREPAAKASKPMNMGLGLGSVTIDDKIYNQIALRPEIKFGKLAVGLDVVIYMDDQGKVREEEWDEMSDYLDKLYYLRWGNQGDPFFAKVGAMDQVTMGYGILMSDYSNTTEYPQVRKVGVYTGMQGKKLGWEVFMANIKEITGPGLIGGRVTYRPMAKLQVGGTIVTDLNQYKGLKDTDEDNVPDAFDAFPDKEFNLPETYPNGAFGNYSGDKLKGKDYDIDSDNDGIPDGLDWDIDGDGLTDSHPDENLEPEADISRASKPFNTEDISKNFTGISFDVGYPIISKEKFKLFAYSEFATLLSKDITYYPTDSTFSPGWGFSAPGLRANILKIINMRLEYRMAGENFMYSFWDRAYDFERVNIRTDSEGNISAYTKDEMKLRNDPMKGIFGSIDVNLLGYVTLGSYYQHMTTGDNEVRSFMATASIAEGKIPKLANAIAYYQRNNDENPFEFNKPSESTILGWRVGFDIGGGAILSYVFQRTYRDLDGNGKIDPDTEAISLNTIETGFNF